MDGMDDQQMAADMQGYQQQQMMMDPNDPAV